MKCSLEWLKEYVDLPSQDEVSRIFTEGGLEVEEIETVRGETVFTFGITPNRADCLSVRGLARDFAALANKKFKDAPAVVPVGKEKLGSAVEISISEPKHCCRYTARLVRGVKVAPSPAWLVQRLEAHGMRSVNNVVDATNLILLETGQPVHAFDAAFLRGKKIDVRLAGKAQKFTTLDGTERQLQVEDLLICDAEGPVALAGVMGGANSEVRESTTDLLLECAAFNPVTIRRTAKRLGLQSESSRRFERGIDANNTLNVLHELTARIVELAGGTPSEDWIDLYPAPQRSPEVTLPLAEVKRILGIELSLLEVTEILKRLGVELFKSHATEPQFSLPTFRPDLTRAIDLIEELARVYGYLKIPEATPALWLHETHEPAERTLVNELRTLLNAYDLQEACTLSFSSEADEALFLEKGEECIRLSNPMSQEEAVLRASLLPRLLRSLQHNKNHQATSLGLFAAQRAYLKVNGKAEEHDVLTVVLTGLRNQKAWEQAMAPTDFYDIKAIAEAVFEKAGVSAKVEWARAEIPHYMHPGKSAVVKLNGKKLAVVGQVHPSVAQHFDLGEVFVFSCFVQPLTQVQQAARYQPLSRYPFVERDVSILVARSSSHADISAAIQKSGAKFIQQVRVFDVYQGKGIAPEQKSVAYSIRYGSSERTLLDNEIQADHELVLKALVSGCGAELRT